MPYAIRNRKVCSACREEKDTSEFRKNRAQKDGFANQCKLCHGASDEKFLARQEPDYMDRIRRRYMLKTHYGITAAAYDAMLEAQGGECKVCDYKPDPGKYLEVDHDHQTGKVRGLLCKWCNRALGVAGDDPARMRALAAYVEEHIACDIHPDEEHFY